MIEVADTAHMEKLWFSVTSVHLEAEVLGSSPDAE